MRTTEQREQPTPAVLREATRDWAHLARAEAVARRHQAGSAVEHARALCDEVHRLQVALRPGEAVLLAGVPLERIWLDYMSLGGDRTPEQMVDYLNGRGTLPEMEIDIFGHVLNEHLQTQGLPPLSR